MHFIFNRIFIVLMSIMVAGYAHAESIDGSDIDADDFISIDELLTFSPDDTQCATAAFERGLAETLQSVSEDVSESEIETLIHQAFAKPDVLTEVLACPEISIADDIDTITFMPVRYTFPGGREIVVNYETQPKILKQRLLLANKPVLPGDANPRIGDDNDDAEWTNTDPAWYGIMVVQHGALSHMVGPDKNNTISLKYIEDNIDALFPQNRACTRDSALAATNNPSMINRAMHETTDSSDNKDTNAYYVAGDVDLQWISYLEAGLDVTLTVATMGGWTVLSGITKSARASRILKNLGTTLRKLSKSENVAKYIQIQNKAEKLNKEIKAAKSINVAEATAELGNVRQTIRAAKNTPEIQRYTALRKNAQTLTKQMKNVTDANEKAQMAARLDNYKKAIKQMENTTEVKNYLGSQEQAAKLAKDIKIDVKKLTQELDDLNKTMKAMEATDQEVKQFKNSTDTFGDINKWRHNLKALKMPQRGNIIARAWRAARAANRGAKTLNRGARVARASTMSGRVRDWLFHSTMRNAGKLARVGTTSGFLYTLMKIGGDMYDVTETSTGDFTNNIQFKPLLLLSADDLQGQENVVNHGMWLMWMGDSTSAADDDAAYLQVLDAADKFHQDLTEVQDEHNEYPCSVDIYIVRPIIRNPGDTNAQLYYLVMNDVPWTTAE